MVKVSLLFISVCTLFCFMIPGFILRKTGLANDSFAKNLSVFVLYVAQVAMLLHGFILEFDAEVFKGICWVFLLALISHSLFYILARRLFQKAPDKIRRVLQFGIIFSNAGYMGIPVINDVFGEEYTIYATVYIVWFNVFAFSLGRLIYTNDKKYISLKEIIVNPAVIPILIGLVIYLSGAGGWVQARLAPGNTDLLSESVQIFYNVLTVLKNTVAPASMIVIGARLADINFRGMLKDKYMYPFILIRLFLFPALMWAVMKLLMLAGILTDITAMSVVLILSSTPAAAITTMFAELYDGDAPYAGKLVALSTLCSLFSMPLVAMLLYI